MIYIIIIYMNSLKNQIYEEVKKQVENKRSNKGIQKRLYTQLKREVPMELILEIRSEIKLEKQKLNLLENNIDELQSKQAEKDDWWLKHLTKTDSPKNKYDVSDRHYIFYRDWGAYPVLISTVREIFASYSKYWKNMSGEEIRQKFRLPDWIFWLIKWATWLYKDSHIDDPITLSRLDSEWLEAYVEWRVEKTIEDKYVETYRRAADRKKDRDISILAKSKRWYEIFLEKLDEVLKSYNPIDFASVKIPENNNRQIKDVFITDAHLGKLWTERIVERFKKMTQDLIESPEWNINITFWWDAGECFVPYGEMHVWQKLWMENIQTADLIMFIVNVFEEMLVSLYKIWKTVTFNGMLWNHDRFTEKKEFDPYRTPWLVIYKFLQRLLEQTSIKINILTEKANIIKSWKIKYVFLHWDGLSEAEIKRRALANISDDSYLIIVSWDKHHYKQVEISDRVLWIQSPALAWQWKYDESLALSSLPWCLEFVENRDWLIDVITKRYK